eukprot:550055-Rhodomonas_salina.1
MHAPAYNGGGERHKESPFLGELLAPYASSVPHLHSTLRYLRYKNSIAPYAGSVPHFHSTLRELSTGHDPSWAQKKKKGKKKGKKEK